jgi:hypothetical protein
LKPAGNLSFLREANEACLPHPAACLPPSGSGYERIVFDEMPSKVISGLCVATLHGVNSQFHVFFFFETIWG